MGNGDMSKIRIAKAAAEKALAAELARTEAQARAAWKFAAGIIVVTGFQLRDVKSLVEAPLPWVKILCGVSLAVLIAALLLAILGLRAKGVSPYPRGFKLWETLKPETVSSDAAEEAVVQMLLQTREQNSRLNDAKDRLLWWCGWLFFAGALLVTGGQLLDAFADWT